MNSNVFDTCSLMEIFEDFDNNYGRSHYHAERTAPLVNVEETEIDFRLELLVPGYSRDEVSLDIEKDSLTVCGKISEEKKTCKRHYRVREFYPTGFEKCFRLGETIDREKISARIENGILTVVCAKSEKGLPRRISIDVET